jgi:hypothetical protein
MNARKRLRKICLIMGLIGATLAVEAAMPAGFLARDAEARVGRPATPASVAGVARRTTRRVVRRTAVYVATLPPACTTIVIEGAVLQQCGGTYYQASGSQYVVVNVE